MARDLHAVQRDKAQLIHQSTMKNMAHVNSVDKTPEPEFQSGIILTGSTGSTAVFAGKNANPGKLT
eukprot:4480585-Karenia_brevis.AAC.1